MRTDRKHELPFDGPATAVHAGTGADKYGLTRRWVRWVAAAVGVLFSITCAVVIGHSLLDEAMARFEAQCADDVRILEGQVRAYGEVLFALRGIFDASRDVTRQDFHSFAKAMSLAERYPAITNVNFAPVVAHSERVAFEEAVRRETGVMVEGLPRFAIKAPAPQRYYTVLNYIEPMGKNVVAWGLDLTSHPERRDAVERARDTGELASSAGATLLRDSNSSVTSVLMRLAVYRGGGVPASLDERRSAFLGVVGSTVRVPDLVAAVLSPLEPRQTRIRIYELEAAHMSAERQLNRLIFDSVNSKQTADGLPDRAFERYTVKRIIRTGDREWLVTFTPRMDPLSNVAKSVSVAVLLVLLASTALMFAVLTSVATNVSQRRLLEKRHCQDELLGALSHDLQNATSLDAACSVVAERVPQVTGCRGGALYLRENSSGAFHRHSTWGHMGRLPPQLSADSGNPESCVAAGLAEVKCGARSRSETVPLVANGETVGLLCLLDAHEGINDASATARRSLRATVGQYVALAVANLRQTERLREQAITDPLTGLRNRRFVDEWISGEFHRAQRYGRPVGAILVDVDHFKQFNDTHGHEIGDFVLRQVAAHIEASSRRSDLACRYGGEEFLLLLPETGEQETLARAEQLRREMEALRLRVDGKPLGRVTVSLGVAVFPADAENPSDLFGHADAALYAAKRAGRNRVVAASSMRLRSSSTQEARPE